MQTKHCLTLQPHSLLNYLPSTLKTEMHTHTHTCAHQCILPNPPYRWVCTMLGAEASSSSGELGGSEGATLFTRANTFTVGGSQLDGLLEEQIQGHPPSLPHLQKTTTTPGLWREKKAEQPVFQKIGSWSLLGAERQFVRVIRGVKTALQHKSH